MKKWTIFIYANGNNELEPEIYERFKQLLEEPINDNKINIVVQLGRAPQDLVKILRKKDALGSYQNWNGVRRYRIKQNKAVELDCLDSINMADPNSLIDFVVWGMKNYPASNNMVIISGHGAGFVGVMTDYTFNYPYIMSMDGLTSSFYEIKNRTGQNVDCLVLDACYMNMVEIWNDITLIPNKPVKYLLAPVKNVALEGLPYYLIIRHLQHHGLVRFKKINKTLSSIIKGFNSDYGDNNKLLVVKLERNYFSQLKKKIDVMGKNILKNNINLRNEINKFYNYKLKDPLISILDLESFLLEKFPKSYLVNERINKILNKIVVFPKVETITEGSNQGVSLYLPVFPEQYQTLKNYYRKLSFIQNNRWGVVVGEKEVITKSSLKDKEKQYSMVPPPMVVPIIYVVAVILEQNPGITEQQAWDMLKEIGFSYKKD